MATVILGLNAYHGDSSACILVDGKLVAAAEEERFRRLKHWAGLPTRAIASCLREAGVQLRDVDRIAINRDPRANFGRKVAFTLRHRPPVRVVADRLLNRRRWGSMDDLLRDAFPGDEFRGRVAPVEHHLAHLASAYLVSDLDDAALLSIDGSGDFATTAWGIGSGDDIRIDHRVYYPHSLGVFYQAITQFLGFPRYGDEYKVMGLAPYGQPRHVDALRRALVLEEGGSFHLDLRYFRHHSDNVAYTWKDTVPSVGHLYGPRMAELLGPPRAEGEELTERHRDIARSLQAVYEEAFAHLLGAVHERYGVERLALAGGCGMNSVANGKITALSPFRRIYIPPAPGDAGGAIGAAVWTWRQMSTGAERDVMNTAFYGPSIDADRVSALLAARAGDLRDAGCTVEVVHDTSALIERVAGAIADGAIVGWAQGRMEWGPRALGNRSILCDPRRADMRETLNVKIKRREPFRPFAPAVLRDHVGDWFETDADVPFMERVFTIRPEQRARIPAVTHVDGTGRLQTVTHDANPRYYDLIAAFHRLTGVPVLLNTSFNENEPIVCTEDEALDNFLRTRMDLLVLGDTIVRRASGE